MTETKPKRRFRLGLRMLLVVVTLAAVGSWGYWVVWPWWQEYRQIAEFKIVAQYEVGFSDWKSWRYAITGDGKVTKDVKEVWLRLKDTKEESKLSNDDLRDLIAKVKEADFFALKERYAPKYLITDSATLILTVTLDKKTHTVVVYAPNELVNDKEVKQFFKAWSEVLRKVPSPNPNQKPDLYKP